MQVYLIRHPMPNNAAGLCYGRQDVPIDANSVAHAAMAVRGRRLSGDDTAVAVTHAGVIRVALALADLSNAAALLQVPVVFGAVHCVDLVQTPVPT